MLDDQNLPASHARDSQGVAERAVLPSLSCSPMLSPADGSPVPGGVHAAVPHGPAGAGSLHGTGNHHPRRGAEGLLDVPAHAAHPGEVPRGGAGHAGHDFLQERERHTHRQPQAEHRHPAGLLQHEGRREKAATETGAGQWGSALAFAGAHFNLDINVFMVRASYEQKPYRKVVMQSYGARVHASPSNETQIGRKMSEDKRNYPARWESRSARRWKLPRPRAER